MQHLPISTSLLSRKRNVGCRHLPYLRINLLQSNDSTFFTSNSCSQLKLAKNLPHPLLSIKPVLKEGKNLRKVKISLVKVKVIFLPFKPSFKISIVRSSREGKIRMIVALIFLMMSVRNVEHLKKVIICLETPTRPKTYC